MVSASNPACVNQDGGAEPLHALIIGAGFAGICAAIGLLKRGVTNFTVVEKSAGIGGTWYENTYPGAACDVPSHLYCYSFEPNPNWSRVYSPQREIWRYLGDCADKYGVTPYIENNVCVKRLVLDEGAGVWQVELADGRRICARNIINGAGGLHKAMFPQIEGRGSFSGDAMHTAHWDHSVDLTGKRVAIIGSAASAIQAIPEIAKVASHLHVFQRTPNYIAPREDREFSEKEKRRFARWPRFARLHRWFIFMRMELLLFPVTRTKSKLGPFLAGRINTYMRSIITDKELQKSLTPDYRLGCKRILISDDYYPALARDNVSVVTQGIESIHATGLRTTDGQNIEVDVLVYATGFDIDGHMDAIEVIGRGGLSLNEHWREKPEAFNGVVVAGFPNFYMLTGPNTAVGTTSVVFMVEKLTDYVLQLMAIAGQDKLIGVKEVVQKRYNTQLTEAFSGTVWTSGCKSWYLREDGSVSTLYPFNARTFARQVKRASIEDFELTAITASKSDHEMANPEPANDV